VRGPRWGGGLDRGGCFLCRVCVGERGGGGVRGRPGLADRERLIRLGGTGGRARRAGSAGVRA
jgi:hypothetical protein